MIDPQWRCRFYYGSHAEPPRRPDDLAIETVHADSSGRDAEVEAGKLRADLGGIEVCTASGGHVLTWARDVSGAWARTDGINPADREETA